MKQFILILLLPSFCYSQNSNNNGYIGVSGSISIISGCENEKAIPPNEYVPISNQKAEWLFNEVKIGETKYDFQANSSLSDRINLHGDGKVSAVFNYSESDAPYADRRTGYTHFDGNNWSELPTNGLEPERAGWSCIGTVEKNGKIVEFIVSHRWAADNSNTGSLFIMTNDEIGSSSFNIDTFYVGGKFGPAYPMAVGSGKYIHIVASNSRINFQMVVDPIKYYRYNVESGKFDREKVLFPELESGLPKSWLMDVTQIDAKGSNVAVAVGGICQDLYLFKSNDNGENWTSTLVDSFGIEDFNGSQTTNGDTLYSNTGSIEMILDDKNNAHIWWSETRIIDETANDSDWYFQPWINSLKYWSETNKAAKTIGRALDINQNGQVELPQGQNSIDLGGRYHLNSITSFPSAGIDKDGNIFLIYSAINEEAFSPEGLVYRDVYVTYSTNGGVEWSSPQPIIEGYNTEDVFACLAKNINEDLHVVWQRDDYPGTAVGNGHEPELSDILYAAISKDDVLNNRFTINRTSIRNEEKSGANLSVFPNPSNGIVHIKFNEKHHSNTQINVYNNVGQLVETLNLSSIEKGQQFSLDVSTHTNGIYYYQIHNNDGIINGSFTIDK